MDKPSIDDWQQHYPTYNFEHRDILIEEYNTAAKVLESEERMYLNASNIILVTCTALGTVIVTFSDKIKSNLCFENSNYIFSMAFCLIVSFFAIISMRYFAERYKSIVFSSRKLVIIRRMLGLSYGNLQLILPNWRVEGANQPLSIRMFPGWFTHVTYPFWILLLSSTLINISTICLQFKDSEIISHITATCGVTLCWFAIAFISFRKSLLDNHESLRLLFGKAIAKIVRTPLQDNTEYILYRAKLASYERKRHHININNFVKMLIFVEDKKYYKHSGVDYKAILRAFLGMIKVKRRSGGSTLTQQLFRTLFISDMSKKIRRKVIEIFLAPWLDKQLGKDYLLEIYTSSVRFENRCYGIIAAMKFFWAEIIKEPTMAQSFFLVERISNIKSSLLADKIFATIKNAHQKGLIDSNDISELQTLYEDAIKKGKIIDNNQKFEMLKNKLQELY